VKKGDITNKEHNTKYSETAPRSREARKENRVTEEMTGLPNETHRGQRSELLKLDIDVEAIGRNNNSE
jgi:hypothetical protein